MFVTKEKLVIIGLASEQKLTIEGPDDDLCYREVETCSTVDK
jgi:hypothetical protein